MVTLANCNRVISELMTMLNTEIKLLRAGQYNDIDHMSAAKAVKFKTLTTMLTSFQTGREEEGKMIERELAPRLAQLKNLSQENGHLLRSVMHGLKSAHDRIHALKHQETQVGVYGRQGRGLSFDEQPRSNELKF